METKTSKLDAIGNPVELGKRYGYSQQNSGWTITVVGEAIKETAKGITLRVLARRRFLYGDPSDFTYAEAEKVNCSSIILFPVEQL
jgi:hypothetical protein